MIRSARLRHRIIWIILAVLLPLIIGAGLLYRHPEPVNQKIPVAGASGDGR